MATTAQINVNLNTQNATENVAGLNKEVTKSLNTLSGLREESARVAASLENVEIGTQAYADLSQELIKVNVQLKNQELALESLDNEQLAGELKSVAGGFADMAGGLALVGASNSGIEKIVQTMAMVEGVTKAVTGGIEAYSSGVKVLNALSAKGATIQSILAAITGTQAAASAATSTALVGQAAATGTATTASNALNASLLLNPILLIVAGIAAAVAALAYFSEESETAEQANDKLSASIDRQTEILDRKNERLIRTADNAVRLAEAEGKSEEEILQLKIDALRKEEDARIRNMQQYEFNIEDRKQLYERALRDGENDLAKSIKKEIEAEKNKLFSLRSLQGQYQADKKILLAESSTKEREEEDKREQEAADKRKQRAEQALKERQANSQKLIQEAKKYADDEELRLAESDSKRLEIVAQRQIKELQLIFDKSQKTKVDNANLAQAILDIEEKLALDKQKIIDKQLAEEQKAKDDAKKLEIKEQEDFNDKIEELSEQNYQNTLSTYDKEIQAINDKYFTLETQAQGNADALVEIEKAKNKEIEDANKRQADADLAKQKEKLEKITQIYAAFAGVVTQGLDIVSQVQEERNARTSEALQTQFNADTEVFNQQLVNREITQAEYDTKIQALEQFQQAKALQLANATIQGGQAVLAAFASGVATPLIGPATGAIFAGIAAAFAATQIGVIASQQFRAAKGGIVPNNGLSDKADSVNALLAPNEAVINSTSTKAFLPLLSAINQAGGGVPLMSEVAGISQTSAMKVYGNDNNQPIQAYITEQQVTSTQNRINNIKQRSKLFK